jgi:hypothetical protein
MSEPHGWINKWTQDVAKHYVNGELEFAKVNGIVATESELLEEFKKWLNEMSAYAWQRGYASCKNDMAYDEQSVNPYRSEQ